MASSIQTKLLVFLNSPLGLTVNRAFPGTALMAYLLIACALFAPAIARPGLALAGTAHALAGTARAIEAEPMASSTIIGQTEAERLIDLAAGRIDGKDLEGFLDDLAGAMRGEDPGRENILLARCQFSLGLYEESLNSLGKIGHSSPYRVTALFNAAEVHAETGDFRARAETMREILDLDPGNTEAKAELSVLMAMGSGSHGMDLNDLEWLSGEESLPGTIGAKASSTTFSAWWGRSTEKPGFPFLTGDLPSYEMTRAGAGGRFTISPKVDARAGFSRVTMAESGATDLKADRIDLGFSIGAGNGGRLELTGGRTDLSDGGSGTSFGAGYSCRQGKFDFSGQAFREFNAHDSTSFASPYFTDGLVLKLGLTPSKGFRLEAAPRFMRISEDDNSMTGASLRAEYETGARKRLVFDLEYDTYGFTREKRDDESAFGYFSPSSRNTLTGGARYDLMNSEKVLLTLSCRLENSSYENSGGTYSMNRVLGGAGLAVGLGEQTVLKADYDLSLSVSDGFQTVHDLSVGISTGF